ncbi:MAG: transposase [Methanosarcinales archaeon]
MKKVLPLKVVLFDRGFTSWELIHVLQKLKVSYIIFWKKQGDWYKEHFNKLEKGEFKRVFRTEKYYRDKIGYKVSSHFVLVKKLEYEGKKYDWIFATNLKLEKAENYVKVYKKRWGIETLFRVTDKIRIYTTSTNHLKRYFLFLFTCLVYNIWKWAQIFIGEDFTLANFKTNMAIFLTKHGLLYPKHYDKFEETMLNNNTPV